MTNSSPRTVMTRRTALLSLSAFGALAACDTVPATPRQTPSATTRSAVSHWSNLTLNAVRAGSVPPPAASRAFAMVHTAGFVAANGVNPQYGTQYATGAGPVGADVDAAYAAAAARAATAAFGRDFGPALRSYLASTGKSDTRAIAWGNQVGAIIAGSRAHDGSATAGTLDTVRYPKRMGQMGWIPTGNGQPALLPGWGKVSPWVIGDARQFLPRAFPAQGSAEFTRQLNKVKALGGTNSATRTPDQTQTAFFWEDGLGGVTPPGHWQLIAMRLLAPRNLGTLEYARAMAMLSMAQADAAIVTWDSKYHYDILRPETALRNANWQPLIPSPAFPAYVSGHSMFSGASAQMLARVLGTDRVAFSGSSPDPQLWPNQLRGVRRSWTSLSQAAAENGASREVGGVHWESDNTEGLRVGAQIANAVFNRAFVRRA